jgi:hypothetical protein
VKRMKSKISRGLVTRLILYQNRQRPGDRPQELKVDVRLGETIDDDYAAAMVAVRTSLPLEHVKVVKVVDPNE